MFCHSFAPAIFGFLISCKSISYKQGSVPSGFT
jgi:hypothetical protein